MFLNNIDPSHDCEVFNNCLIIDAGIKTEKRNGFNRPWPNIVSMNKETISKIDKNWGEYFKIPFIASPSKKLESLIKGNSEIFDLNQNS